MGKKKSHKEERALVNNITHLYLKGEIDETNTSEIIKSINELNYNSINDDYINPIVLHIQSTGGSVPDAFALIDTIMTSRIPVYTYCDGYAMSSAFIVFLAGARRFVYPHSEFLAHPITCSFDGSYNASKATMNNEKELNRSIFEIIQQRTNVKKKTINKWLNGNRDYYIYADEAISLGIATDMVR
jgi:ATP-dependent Clp protease protease subunit